MTMKLLKSMKDLVSYPASSLFLATCFDHSSHLVGRPDSIQGPHRADGCNSCLVGPHCVRVQ